MPLGPNKKKTPSQSSSRRPSKNHLRSMEYSGSRVRPSACVIHWIRPRPFRFIIMDSVSPGWAPLSGSYMFWACQVDQRLSTFSTPITINKDTGHILVLSYISTDAGKHNEWQRQALFLCCAGCLRLLILRGYRRPSQGKCAREKVIGWWEPWWEPSTTGKRWVAILQREVVNRL